MTGILNMGIEKRANTKVIICYWAPPLAYMVFIFLLSSMPVPRALPEFAFADKLYHTIEYGILGILVLRALWISMPDRGLRFLFVSTVIFSTFYGLTDEIHQYFVPGRFSSIYDVMADGIGSFIGAYIYINVGERVKGNIPNLYNSKK